MNETKVAAMSKNPNEVRGSEPNAAQPPPDAARDWRDHEHVAEPARVRAAQKNGKPAAVADDEVLSTAVRDEGGDRPPGKDA